jgi:hypothetical protein
MKTKKGKWAYTIGSDWYGAFNTQEEAENYCIEVLGYEIDMFSTGLKGIDF